MVTQRIHFLKKKFWKSQQKNFENFRNRSRKTLKVFPKKYKLIFIFLNRTNITITPNFVNHTMVTLSFYNPCYELKKTQIQLSPCSTESNMINPYGHLQSWTSQKNIHHSTVIKCLCFLFVAHLIDV